MHYSDILQNCIIDYVANINIPPRPSVMADELLNKIYSAIETENVNRQNNNKIKYPHSLPPVCIATLINEFFCVRRIVWTGYGSVSERENNNILSIYQDEGTNEGIYVSHRNAFARLIRQFDYNISSRAIDEVIAVLKEISQVAPVTKEPGLIAVNNGIFNFNTKELMCFSPDFVFTSKSKVDYNPQARNITIHNDMDNTDWDVKSWMQELSDNPQIVELIWQTIGAVIRPNVPWNRVVCFYSETGCSGKGTICQVMNELCSNTASLSFEDFSNNFLLEPLIYSSAIIADENNTNGYINAAATLKAVITGDRFSLDCKFQKPITFRFRGLMVQCINSMPRFKDKTASLARRLLMIPFDKCFTGQAREYIKEDYLKRTEVLEYVLYKVLNMDYDEKAWRNENLPLECQQLLLEFKEFNNPVEQFLNEVLDECKWDLLPWNFLYALYCSWFKKNNPSGQTQGKSSFVQDVKILLKNSDEWKFEEQRSKNRMDAPEPLILQYDLNDWKNPSYHGTDEDKICMPALKPKYRGLVRQ